MPRPPDNKFYNELMFDPGVFALNLPHSLMAIFYLDDSDPRQACGGTNAGELGAQGGYKCKEYAIAAHRATLQHFGLTSADLPLVKLDLWEWTTPFVEHVDGRG